MITSQLNLERAITNDFHENIARPLNVRVAWPNARFERPDDAPWIILSIVKNDKVQRDFGASSHGYRTTGVVFANVYIPLGLGSARALEIADKILGRYRDVMRDGVYFETASVGSGRREAGLWKIPVQCPFYADSIEG